MEKLRNKQERFPEILLPIIETYETRFKSFGSKAQGVFWKNKDFQYRRFKILAEIFEKSEPNLSVSIHDFGSGYGAFFDYLKNLPIMQNGKFLGTDISMTMIKQAQKRINDPRARFICSASPTELNDYTFASGTFNLKMSQEDKPWEAYIKETLTDLWSLTRKGMAFNILRNDAEKKFKGLFYTDGLSLLHFLQTSISPNVIMQNDRPLPDWSFFIRRV